MWIEISQEECIVIHFRYELTLVAVIQQTIQRMQICIFAWNYSEGSYGVVRVVWSCWLATKANWDEGANKYRLNYWFKVQLGSISIRGRDGVVINQSAFLKMTCEFFVCWCLCCRIVGLPCNWKCKFSAHYYV